MTFVILNVFIDRDSSRSLFSLFKILSPMFKASHMLFPIRGFIKHVLLAWHSHTTIKVKYLLFVLTRAMHSGALLLVSESAEVQQHIQQASPPTLLM